LPSRNLGIDPVHLDAINADITQIVGGPETREKTRAGIRRHFESK